MGTVDSDYRGPVKVLLYNTTKEPYHIQKGDRIAQACLATTVRISFAQCDIRGDETERVKVDLEAQGPKFNAIGNDSGVHVSDISADCLSLMPNGDRVLLDEDGEIVGVFR